MRTFQLLICISMNIVLIGSTQASITVSRGTYKVCASWSQFFPEPTLIFNLRSRSQLKINLVNGKTSELKAKGHGLYLFEIEVTEDQVLKNEFQAKLNNYSKCDRKDALFYVVNDLKPAPKL